MATELVPATHEAEVELFVQIPLTVQVDEPRFTRVPAPRTVTDPETETLDPFDANAPWRVRLPFTVRGQLEPVSSVPVKPVMSTAAMVVAADSVIVPVGFVSKTAVSVTAGVHPHAGPPE
jgi:hypothetical protein